MTLAEYQNKTVFCVYCGASALWSEDDERIITDWDIFRVDDPCSDGCHVPEDEIDQADLAMDYVDAVIGRIRELGSFIEAVDSMPVQRIVKGVK